MLEIHCRSEGDVEVLELRGRMIGGPELYELATQVRRKLGEGRRLFLFDFSGVPFLGSLGIGILAQTHAAIEQAGGRDLLLSLPSQARASLRVNGLVPVVLREADDEASALEQLRADGRAGEGEA